MPEQLQGSLHTDLFECATVVRYPAAEMNGGFRLQLVHDHDDWAFLRLRRVRIGRDKRLYGTSLPEPNAYYSTLHLWPTRRDHIAPPAKRGEVWSIGQKITPAVDLVRA